MLIRCWGARGSIPVSGCDFVKYGGDTTCLEIRTTNDEVLIIDAGSGIRNLGKKLAAEGRREYFLLFTHGHWDHLMGFPFFAPIYDETAVINIYGCHHEGESIKAIISPTMKPPHFPVPYEDIKAHINHKDICKNDFHIGSLQIIPIALSHPNQGLGYKLVEGGKSLVFLTDNELTYVHEGGLDFSEYVRFVKGTDLLIHDAEYNALDYRSKKGWGHSVYTDALELAIQGGVKRFALFHHNQDRTDVEVDNIVADCRRIIAQRGVELDCLALSQSMEFVL